MSVRIIVGDALAELRNLADESVQTCVTSPPYWGLRAYSTEHQVFGGDPSCAHAWDNVVPAVRRSGGTASSTLGEASGGHGMSDAGRLRSIERQMHDGQASFFCALCGAWRGELGLEPDYLLYVEHLVEIFREVRRVLRRDGTLWLNLGDCYATAGAGKVGERPGGGDQGDRWNGYRGGHKPEDAGKAASRVQAIGPMTQPNRMPQPGLKPKDLAMIPARVAIALQDDGWWLRSDIIWDKVNPMPESVTDRPTTSHEHVFLLTRSERYFYDGEAIKEGGAQPDRQRMDRVGGLNGHTVRHSPGGMIGASQTRNKRSVWAVATQPFPGAHFATFPPKLIEPCIMAGTSEKGVCAKCGAPWARITETEYRHHAKWFGNKQSARHSRGSAGTGYNEPIGTKTTGWQPSCACNAAAAAATVLDPFLGSGTTLMVADRLGRNGIGIELNPDYAKMAKRRCREPGFAFDLATAPTESKEP